MSAVIEHLRAVRRRGYNGGLAGERSKAARAAKLNLPPGTPAGKDYVEQVYLPSLPTGTMPASTTPTQTVTPTPITDSPATGGLFDSLPKKILGIQTWMWVVGGVLLLLVVFKKRR